MSSSNQVLLDINQDPLLIIERDFKGLHSGSTDFGTDYQSCVTELFEARLAGVLGATDAEIYEECR